MHEGEAECNLPHHVGRICLAERLVLLEILSKMSPLSASSTKAVVPGKTMKRVGQTNDMTVCCPSRVRILRSFFTSPALGTAYRVSQFLSIGLSRDALHEGI